MNTKQLRTMIYDSLFESLGTNGPAKKKLTEAKFTKRHAKDFVKTILSKSGAKSVENVIPKGEILYVSYTNYKERAKIIKTAERVGGYTYDTDGRSTNAPRILGVSGYNWISFISEGVVTELRSDMISGTSGRRIDSLEDRKYELKKDAKGATIGSFSNVTLPKGTIIYNLPGGVFADHFSLKNKYASRSSQGPRYFDKPTFKGIMIKQTPAVLSYIEKNSKVLESVSEGKMPGKYIGNDEIVFIKTKEDSRGAQYSLYYKGYDIDAGGQSFSSEKELKAFASNYILSNQWYNKLKHKDAKPLPESVNEAKDNLYLQLHKKYADQIKGLKAKKIKKLTDLVSVQRWAMEAEHDTPGHDHKKMSKAFNNERKLFKQYLAGDHSVMLPESINEGKGAKNYFDDLKFNYTKSLRYLDKDEQKEYNKLAKDFFSKISESVVTEGGTIAKQAYSFADYFGVPVSLFKGFKFDGTDDIGKLHSLLKGKSSNLQGTTNIYNASLKESVNEAKLRLKVEVPIRDPEAKKFIHNYLLLNKKYSMSRMPEYSMKFGGNKWKKETHWKYDTANNILYVHDAKVVDILVKGKAPSDLFESNLNEINEGLKVKDWHEETRPDKIVIKTSNGKTLEITPKRSSSEKSYQAWLQILDQYKTNSKAASYVDKTITQMANESINEARKEKIFKKGAKVKYLSNPGVVTKVEKDFNDRVWYSVKYSDNWGKNWTTVSKVLSTDGSVTEAKLEKEKFTDPEQMRTSESKLNEAPSIWKKLDQIMDLRLKGMDVEQNIMDREKELKRLYQGQEQEAEPEGGRISNRYAKDIESLTKILDKDKAILKYILKKIDKLDQF